MTNLNNVEGWIENLLNNYSLDEIFEEFELEPEQVLMILFREGLIDPVLLEEVCGN